MSELGIAPGKQVVGLLTNVMWDAQLHFRASAFSSMLDWLHFTIEHFVQRPDIQLVIRIHPAEVMGTVPSRQRVSDEIAKRWPNLPANIVVVGPENPTNTYALMRACDSVLVYGTKMAIELPCWGIPVVVAGEAWARGKGFTRDVSSPGHYSDVLSSLPSGQTMPQHAIDLARRYAHYLFFRRMIPVGFARRNRHLVPIVYEPSSLDELRAGGDPGLEVICDGILDGRPFALG